ncbi:MAG TPA: vitamin K epoxide reductase family protein [Patescibacteria group bacterium]|nr:vitamin K epoxide reductase family protein [Patescibacteria group bacterium]
MKQRTLYGIMTTGGVIGLAAAFTQSVEKITLLKQAGTALSCDLNSVFSCSTVLSAWQSSVFGFPNSLMCLILFTIFSTVALVGFSGGALTQGFRRTIQGLSLGTLGFALWFLEQSIYSIGSLCILCIFCFIGLLIVNALWLRINARDLTAKNTLITRMIAADMDIVVWIVLAIIVALAMVLRFS